MPQEDAQVVVGVAIEGHDSVATSTRSREHGSFTVQYGGGCRKEEKEHASIAFFALCLYTNSKLYVRQDKNKNERNIALHRKETKNSEQWSGSEVNRKRKSNR